MAYRFDKNRCTEPWVGYIHALAVYAAITNRWPYSFIPEVATKENR